MRPLKGLSYIHRYVSEHPETQRVGNRDQDHTMTETGLNLRILVDLYATKGDNVLHRGFMEADLFKVPLTRCTFVRIDI